ncbi:hypothetical protein BH11BAC1_BH11BAC1_09740 [soil metagenome]
MKDIKSNGIKLEIDLIKAENIFVLFAPLNSTFNSKIYFLNVKLRIPSKIVRYKMKIIKNGIKKFARKKP